MKTPKHYYEIDFDMAIFSDLSEDDFTLERCIISPGQYININDPNKYATKREALAALKKIKEALKL